MPVYSCAKGHESADSDFCSVCGAKMPEAFPGLGESPGDARAGCPDCGAPRETGSGAFCELCGYNFETGVHGERKPVSAAPQPPEWEVIVTVDGSLQAPGSPAAPPNVEPRTIPLAKDSNLIGRKSEKRGVFPEIPLDADDAVSHRHAFLNKTPEGGLVLRDLGSSNGTVLNGSELAPLVDAPLKDGDQFTVGHWTRVVVRAAP